MKRSSSSLSDRDAFRLSHKILLGALSKIQGYLGLYVTKSVFSSDPCRLYGVIPYGFLVVVKS